MLTPGHLLRILLLALPFPMLSQVRPLSWEFIQGDRSDQEFHAGIQISSGQIALPLGYDAAGGFSRYILLLDYSTGKLVSSIPVPDSEGKVNIQSLLELPDGSLLLCGQRNETEAWLGKLYLNGDYTPLSFPAVAELSTILQIALLEEDRIIIHGLNKLGDDLLVQCNLAGKTLWSKQWETRSSGPIRKFVVGPDNLIGVVGNTVKSSSQPDGNVYTTLLDAAGNELWRKFFGGKLWEEVSDVKFLQDGGVVFCGETNSAGSGKQDMWIICLDKYGNQQWERTYGGREEDRATALLQLHNGNLLLTGSTLSILNKKGANKFAVRIAEFDPAGTLKWEEDFGGGDDEQLQHLLQLHNGDILAFGWTKSTGNGGKDGWAICLNGDPGLRVFKKGILQIDNTNARLGTPDEILRPDQRTFLSFEIVNQEEVRLDNIRIEVKITDGQNGIFIEKNLVGQPLPPGVPRKIFIPVQSGPTLDTKENILQIDLFSGPDKIKSFKTSLKTLNPLSSILRIANVRPTREGKDEFSPILIRIEVQNDGDRPAENAQVLLFGPKGLLFLNGQSAILGNIPPKSIASTQIRLQKTAQYPGKEAEIQLEVQDKSGKTVSKTVQIRFDDWTEPGQSTSFVIFTQPNEARTKRIEWNQSELYIEATLGTSANTVKNSDIVVKINGETLPKTKNFEGNLSLPSRQGPLFFYVYSNTIPLGKGENRVSIEVKTPQGVLQSNEIFISYQPRQPNLHLLSIGVPHQDLKYNTRDAGDLANAFYNQAGPSKIFGNIFVETRNTKENTRNLDIRAALEDLRRRYTSEMTQAKIYKEDILLLFISSPGKINDRKELTLYSSDYETYGDVSNIDLKRDILDVLKEINCKKILLLDIFQRSPLDPAGSVGQGRLALEEIARAYPGLNILSACQSDEISREDSTWENGAFTEALLEALQPRLFQNIEQEVRVDRDGDQVIRLGELYDFLKVRIPVMVQRTKQSKQIPVKMYDGTGDEIPIYILY